MAFGKKKAKAAAQTAPAPKKLDMNNNPLYPAKQESELKEIASAIGIAIACLFLVSVIISNFNVYSNYQETEQQTYAPESSDTESYDTETDTDAVLENPSENETPEEEVIIENKDYIIADSNTRYISVSELENMSAEELSRARNEIYARHGRLFKDAGLQSYFDSKDWYNGTISPDSFSESMLNEVEKENAATILSVERAKGYK